MLKRILLYWITLLYFITIIKAGPVITNQRSNRIIREIYPEIEPENDGNQAQVCIVGDVVYGIDEPVPAEQPCLKCRCQPPGVQCETIKCTKKPGCKAIHRPNKCCPDYQCECEHEGKIYANGERLKTLPGGECKVCYCRGGELQCAQVSCYIRSDCQARTVPGQCCPKYDNCPPIETLTNRSSFTTVTMDLNREVLTLRPLMKIAENSSAPTTTTTDESQEINKIQDSEIEQNASDDLPTITIQEIIPEIKEIPITPSPKSDESTGSDDDDNNNNDNIVVTDSDTDSSEVSEIFQQPPPILRIGDKLLFLKQGEFISEKDVSTPSTVITIIGAEGLQPGYEDSSEILHDEHEQKQYNNNSNDLETKASETTHILSLVKRKKTPTTSTTTPTTENQPTETTINDDGVTEITTILPENQEITTISMEFAENSTDSENITETFETTALSETTTEIETTTTRNSEIDEIPTIGNDEIGTNSSNINNLIKIIPDILILRNNKTIPTNTTTHNEWLKNHTLFDARAILPDDILKTIVPSDVEAATITDIPENLTTLETERSMESLEITDDDTGRELTTPKTNYKQIQTNDSSVGSIETIDETTDKKHSEITDMLGETNQSKIDDIEMINDGKKVINDDVATTINPMKKDVEIIENLKNLTEFNDSNRPKIVEKRENNQNDEIFKQLNDELSDNDDDDDDDEDDGEHKSKQIFKELLEETSTPKSRKIPQNKDEETLQRISDAIASITFNDNNNNNNNNQRNLFNRDIFGLISNLFGSQSKNRE